MVKALYRQYRPKTFDEVLGQDRVVNVLKNQVESNLISHAYLFAGERGCGKTSCAKIFAKAINCQNPKNGSPCLECESCKEIEEESTMDIVEMDAASNRRIDDIRALKETVIYPPNNLKYKVYIIDEAHMITKEAFNALLKIMEEPPSHLVFILATTEIEKIPKTILSRVQKFEFNKIGDKEINQQINIILKDLNLEMDDEAKKLIIAKAKGAMRDALSILDTVLSLNKSYYSIKDVESILGLVDEDELKDLARSIVNYDQKTSLEKVFSLRENNKSNKEIIDSLINYFRDLLLYKSCGKGNANDDLGIDTNVIVDYLEILIEYLNKINYSENTDILTEMCVIRLTTRKDSNDIDSRLRALERRNEGDIVSIINKLLDEKLNNLDISNLKTSKNTKSSEKEIPTNNEKSQSKNKKIEKVNVDKKEENFSEPKQELVNSLNENTKEEKISENIKVDFIKLDEKSEKSLKIELIKSCGALIRSMFITEGFNYEIKDNVFSLYFDDELYKNILEDKLEDIGNIVRSFTKDVIEVKIISAKEKEKNQSNTLNKEIKNVDKLKSIFGEDLIIE